MEMPLGISIEILAEITQGIYPGTLLDVSTEIMHVVPSGFSKGFVI